jgi:predicted dehydrogenase
VGALGVHHARIYSRLSEAELVAVVDIKPDRAHEVAQQYGCQAFTDFRELLGKVEAVSVAVPTEQHALIGSELLAHGVHVLIEKPMAGSLDEADSLIEAQRRSGCVLHVGHTERFNPAVSAVLPLVTTPRFFEAHRLGVFVPRSLDIDVVLDLMIHDLDLVLALNSSPIREIRAVGIPVLTPRVDIANARVEFADGCVANITASRVSKEKIRKLRFFQPHDYVSLDFFRQEIEMYSLVDGVGGKQIRQRSFDICRGEPLQAEIGAFLRAVRGEPGVAGRLPPCLGEAGRKSLELALQVLDAMQR